VQTSNISFEITKASEEDLIPLLEMARQAFLEAFTVNNNIQNVMAYLDKAFSESQFRKEISNPASTFFLAKDNQEIIGYTKVNLVPAQTDIYDPKSVEIARLYVLEDYLGYGLGKSLLDIAVDFARQNEKKYLWLGVWEHNPRAIRFYEKNGFEKFSSHHFPFGDEIQTDWLMRKDF
jgi:ribosomal protein S18 acetylase RimI-like enzyme